MKVTKKNIALTPEQALEIKNYMYFNDVSYQELAKKFKTTRQATHYVLNQKARDIESDLATKIFKWYQNEVTKQVPAVIKEEQET